MRERNRSVAFLKTLSTLLVVLVHGSNLFAIAGTQQAQVYTLFRPIAAFARVSIPVFTASSAYLLFRKNVGWAENYRKKIRSLLIPYVLWMSFHALVFILPDNVGTVLAWSPSEWFSAWIGIPFADMPRFYPALWFVRDLLILNLVFPAFRYLLRKLPGLMVLTAAVIWFSPLPYYARNMLTWFIVGGLLAIYPDAGAKLKKAAAHPVCYGLSALACGLIWLAPESVLAESAAVAVFTVTLYGASERLARRTEHAAWWKSVSAHSFVIYALHGPLLEKLQRAAVGILPQTQAVQALEYLALPCAAALVCLAAAAVFKRLLPSVYAVMTGGRNA